MAIYETNTLKWTRNNKFVPIPPDVRRFRTKGKLPGFLWRIFRRIWFALSSEYQHTRITFEIEQATIARDSLLTLIADTIHELQLRYSDIEYIVVGPKQMFGLEKEFYARSLLLYIGPFADPDKINVFNIPVFFVRIGKRDLIDNCIPSPH